MINEVVFFSPHDVFVKNENEIYTEFHVLVFIGTHLSGTTKLFVHYKTFSLSHGASRGQGWLVGKSGAAPDRKFPVHLR